MPPSPITQHASDGHRAVSTIRPSAIDMSAVKNLDRALHAIASYIGSSSLDEAPAKIGHIYLAFALALASVGALKSPSEAPVLSVQHAGCTYEVLLDEWATALSSEEESQALHDPMQLFRASGVSSQSPASSTAGDTEMKLLGKIRSGLAAAKGTSSSSGGTADGPASLRSGTAVALQSVTPSQALASALRTLDHAELASLSLTTQVNRAYYRLGVAYVSFGCRAFSQCPPPLSTAFHRLVFGVALTALRGQCTGSHISSESALKKRFERARKFYVITEVFGEGVLELARDVSVTSLDKTSFRMLGRLKELASASQETSSGDPGVLALEGQHDGPAGEISIADVAATPSRRCSLESVQRQPVSSQDHLA